MLDNNFGKVLITVGVIFILMGVLFLFYNKIPLFKLPGDIVIKKGNFSFYFPIVSCLILSALFTLISLIIKFIKK